MTMSTDIAVQKQLVYNKLLPYSDLLADESSQRLSIIKGCLGRSVQLRDFDTGTVHWIAQLSRYIKLFGYNFTKHDHITFVKTLFELVTLPDVDYGLVQKFAQCLIILLKKKDLLTRDDISIAWRPLYLLYKNAIDSPLEEYGLVFFPLKIEETLRNLINVCRPYFTASATKEMLDEWRPLICPTDVTMSKAINYLELFLPTVLPPELFDQEYRLWFNELMQLWCKCGVNSSWDPLLVNLFTRLAHDHLGYVDWRPHSAHIFTRILACFGLPIGSHKNPAFQPSYDIGTVASWIVSMLGAGCGAQESLNTLLGVLKSYYHPSNAGPWTPKLLQFLSHLSRNIVDRVFRERYKPPSWLTPVPQTAHLSNADVTAFVESMLPIVLVAMFSKGLRADVAIAFQHLSSLRPEIVIPPLLEQTYPALETLTEPHRLTACLMCVNTVVRSMVSSTQWFPQGRMHVIPLLNLCLPGIDPNDSRKSLITFQLISNLCSLVPIVNSSEAIFSRTDLTEDEKELCSATSQFEDFVLVFLDRVISLVENSSHEHTRTEMPNALQLDQEEKIVGLGLLTVASTVFQQCSSAIYDEALKKLCSFVIGSVFEIHVGGIYVAVLVQAAVKARPERALKIFVPHFMNIVRARSRHEIVNEEHLDAEFVWSVKMLTELAGSECNLLAYLPDFMYVLELTLHVKSKRVREMAGLMLRQLLKYMTTTYPVEYRSTTVNFDNPQIDVLPIREWGKPGDLHNLDISWHVASEAERQAATQVLRTFLLPELDSLRQHLASNTLSREELLQSLMIINHCIVGASFLLPPLQGDEVKLVDSQVELRRFDVVVKDSNSDIAIDGQNVRMMVLSAIRPLLTHILATSADDTKSLTVLIRLYASLLYVNGITKLEYNSRCNSRALSKRSLENRLIPKKKHMRILLIDRIALQHEMRIVYRTHERFTTVHQQILKDLFSLSVSDYGLVRQVAQTNLWLVFRSFAYAYKVLTEDILECLRGDCGISKERFKGALYLIQGNSQHSLLTKKHWDFVSRLWPALVRAQHSEDLSVMKVFDELAQRLKQEYQTLSLGTGAGFEDSHYRQLLSSTQRLNNIESEITMIDTDGIDFVEVESPDDTNTQHIDNEEERSLKQVNLNSALAVVEHLWDEDSTAKPVAAKATGRELESAVERELDRNKEHLRLYYGLVDDLVSYLENTGTVRWKFYQLALDMLSFLVRHDVRLPARAVRLLVKGLVSDSLPTRQSCLSAITSVLKQQKRRHLKVEVNPYEMGAGDCRGQAASSQGKVAAVPSFDDDIVSVMRPGDRPDNRWLQYDSRTLPTNKQAWQECVFVEKTHWGYYTWPKPMLVYASIDKQPKIGRLPEELKDDELPFYEMFTDAAFVEKFIRFLSVEEHRAHEKFQMKNFMFFKGLFRNFDDAFVSGMRPHIEKLMEDREHGTRETSQRCVAEIVAALIRSSKHWDYDRVQNLWSWLIPVLKTVLVNITTETLQDWTVFFYLALESRDPRKMVPLLELLMDNPIRGEGGSFGDCSRLTMLQTALGQQEWRVSELQHRLLAYIQPNITHPYKNVRDRVGSMLMNIFLTDSVFPGAMSHAPHLVTFISAMLAQLNSSLSKRSITAPIDNQGTAAEPMEVDAGTSSGSASSAGNKGSKLADNGGSGTETGTDEHKAFVRTCKTLLKLLQEYLYRSVSGLAPEMLGFLPIVCQLERDSDDEDLRLECSATLSLIGLAPLSAACVPVMLDTVRQILTLELWHARETVLKLLQVIVFSNLFILQKHSKDIERMIVEKLHDPHIEVRTMASVTLSGLFQCGFLTVTDEITKQFAKMARTAVSKQKAGPGDKEREQKLVTRHAGVLGMCACIQAYPYDVPDFMPALLVKLSEHVNDSQIIQATVKKSLSNFKRTHHDSWHNHKQKFTDDQLTALTELLVSPNYYA